jgi:hypothetical protein
MENVILEKVKNIGSLCLFLNNPVNNKYLELVNSSVSSSEFIELPLSERIWYFFNKLVEIQRCDCGDKLSFIGFKNGYRKSCGKKECFVQKRMETCIEKYGVDNPSKFEDFKTKRKGTMIERFGVDYYVLHAEFREKSEKSFMQNFGVKHPMKIKDEVRKRLNKKGLDFETDEYKIYRNKVDYLTRKNKKTLYDSWNGFDFYDKEYILENLHLPGQHGDYPTIDHKKSVKECFDEGLLPLYVAEIDNLCITKRRVNSKKNKKSNFIL